EAGSGQTATVPPGEVKGTAQAGKAAPKDAPTTMEQVAGAKGGDPTTQTPPAEARPGPQEGTQSAGNARAGDRKDATLDDVSQLREQLGDSAQRDLVEKALDRISEEARDPKVRQAAAKAVEEAKAQPGLAKGTQPPSLQAVADSKAEGTPADPKEVGAGASKRPQDGGRAAKTKEGDGPGKPGPTAKSDPRKPGSGTPGTANQGRVGQDAPAAGTPVDEVAARRAGELQLELLKDQIDKLRQKITPEVMKRLNWT